ncbi:hypothetical protein LAU_0019 [Lausannevirus]|uniref:Uncharacterized protein n=1 Tax=Lausannevirus TaxID=999883 RepID=F2WKV2_9VIRU|nr:hypothetical protein LAU_0019 [Lausannevirus]AEA06875.1 hypothetical protein LAU_0019 [Lausannevirus]
MSLFLGKINTQKKGTGGGAEEVSPFPERLPLEYFHSVVELFSFPNSLLLPLEKISCFLCQSRGFETPISGSSINHFLFFLNVDRPIHSRRKNSFTASSPFGDFNSDSLLDHFHVLRDEFSVFGRCHRKHKCIFGVQISKNVNKGFHRERKSFECSFNGSIFHAKKSEYFIVRQI